jgi:hypothetical protein
VRELESERGRERVCARELEKKSVCVREREKGWESKCV